MTTKHVFGMVALATFLVAVMAGAASTNPSRRTLVYRGHLDKDGAPVDGAITVRVGLFTTPDADASCLSSTAGTCGAWRDELTAVVHLGEFSIVLGGSSANPLSDAVVAQPALYLGLAVRGSGESAFTVLGGVQRLHSSPYALRATDENDFTAERFVVSGANGGISGGNAASNLHIDSTSGGGLYLNYFSQRTVHVGSNGSGAGRVVMDASGNVSAASFNGPLNGNVSGNVTGGVTGNVTGNVTGDVVGKIRAAGSKLVTLGVKTGNNGSVNCDVFCYEAYDGWRGVCLGAFPQAHGHFTADCSSLFPPAVECLCAAW